MRYISNILKNSYSKADKEQIIRRPRLEDVPSTCFFSAKDLVIFEDSSKEPCDDYFTTPDTKEIVDMISEEKL